MKKILLDKRLWLFAIVFIMCIILGTYFYTSNKEKKESFDYSDYYISVKNESTENIENELSENILSLEKLQADNSDVIGIIEFDNKSIYEPIAQGKDNQYYLYHNYKGQYSAAGIPFVAEDSNIFATNVVIYGHSSQEDDIIFTSLMNYKNIEYYKEHPTFKFQTLDETRTYQIFAVLSYDTNDINDSVEFTQSEWRKQSDYAYFLTSLQTDSLYDTNVTATVHDKIMTLVTCDTKDTSKRLVVIGRLM